MILEIPALIRELIPQHMPDGRVSVVRIETTTPLYLVFAGGSVAPRWVLRIGPGDSLRRTHGILDRLHGLAPALVPQSLLCQPWRGAEWVHVQSGVSGRPWFQLREYLAGEDDWARARHTALQSLDVLHSAIKCNPDWAVPTVDVAAEVRRQLDASAALRAASALVARAWDTWRDALANARPTACFWQHGDFCLNNLIFLDSTAAVIDFDEFGLTAMPLHDQFSLALSFADLMPPGFRQSLADHLAFCLVDVLRRQPWLTDQLEVLFLHHLLWKIARYHAHKNRAHALRLLIDLLEEHALHLDRLFVCTRGKLSEGISSTV
jgi:hypothetical protein